MEKEVLNPTEEYNKFGIPFNIYYSGAETEASKFKKCEIPKHNTQIIYSNHTVLLDESK